MGRWTELRDGRLVALPWTGRDLDITVRMIRRKDKHLSPAILAFQEIVRELLAALPA
jgi:DNA-binding transcriptional LysR family regulator